MTTEVSSPTAVTLPAWPRPAWIGALPRHIQSLLEDVYRLLDTGESALALAGLRMLVEQVVRDGVGANGTLHGRINELHTRGCISTRERSRLLDVVKVGNAAVHEGTSVSPPALRHLLMCVEHLLQGHFVLRQPPAIPLNRAT